MENIEIHEKWGFGFTPGYYAIFNVNGQYYYASLALVFCEPEVMIFKSDETGQFSFEDALGEYSSRDVDFTPDALRDCIEEFVASLS